MKQLYSKVRINLTFVLITGLVLLFFTCTAKNPILVEGDWVSDIPFIVNHVNLEYGHDNRIFESEHFLVFSDASEDEFKRRWMPRPEMG